MEHTRTVGRRIGGGANSITSIGDDMHGMQLEMVATSSEIREGKETKEEKEEKNKKNKKKNEEKGNDTNDNNDDATVVNINAVTVSMEEQGVVEWKLQLRHLEVAEKTTDVLNVFKALHAVVIEYTCLKTNEKKMELIKNCKEKKARNKTVWTKEVAVEFRKVLQLYQESSLLAVMGMQTPAVLSGGLRQISTVLRNPFGRSSSKEEEEEKEEDDDDLVL